MYPECKAQYLVFTDYCQVLEHTFLDYMSRSQDLPTMRIKAGNNVSLLDSIHMAARVEEVQDSEPE